MESYSNGTHLATKQLKLNHETPASPTSPFQLHKLKPILHNKAKWRCLTPSDLSNINKYKPKMLSRIQLTHIYYENIRASGMRNLRKALVDNKRVSFLIFGKDDWYNQDAKQLQLLLNFTNRWKGLMFSYVDDGENFLSKEAVEGLIRIRNCTNLSNLQISFYCREQVKDKILARLSKQARWLRHLKALNLDTSNCDGLEYMEETEEGYDPNASLLKFKPPRSLSSLSIDFEGGIFVNEILSIFAFNIRQCYELEHLNLDFTGICHNIEPSEARIWVALFEKLQNLKTLTITRYFYCSKEFEGTKIFLEGIPHLKSLQSLKLCFSFNVSKNHPLILTNTFYMHLARLPHLKSLHLDFSFLKCPKNGDFQGITSNLQLLTQLEELHFRLPNCANVKNGLVLRLAHELQSLKNLKHLEIYLLAKGVSYEGVAPLAETLTMLPHLNILNINFMQSNLDHKSVEVLSNSIANHNLTSFSLVLTKLRETKSTLQKLASLWQERKRLTSLFSALYGLNLLSNLHLNLSTFDVTTAEFKHFALALKELQKLQSLSLELPKFNPENNFEGLRKFLLSLKEIKNLSSLNLVFGGGGKVSNKEISIIAAGLKECCKPLESLHLHFKLLNHKGNDSFRHLIIGLTELKRLRNLKLDLNMRKVFKIQTIVELLQGLTVMKRLEAFVLNYNRRAPNADFHNFVMNLKGHKNFRCLNNFIVNGFRYI